MRIVALHNQKGGVGKTASTINLGAALAAHGQRVLLVDLDPQGNMTSALGVADGAAETMLPLALLGRWEGALRELVVRYRDRIDLIPTHEEMFLVEAQLYPISGREWRLSALLDAMAPAYDVCLIDCPPSLGALTDNALVAARRERGRPAGGIVIPVQSEDSSLRALELLYRQLDSLQAGLRVEIETLGLVISQYDGRRGSVVTSTRTALEGLGLPILGVVGDRAVIRAAWREHLPVPEYDPGSDAAGWYQDIAAAVMSRMEAAA
jgi:chromosome partitioning protein